ncbi:MAG: N-formylglutamate amidohydrolase [Aggregatilineales bacterium]
MENIWTLTRGDSPLVATAIHDGHLLRPDVAQIMALTDAERLREEDPFTALWTAVSDTRVAGTYSRFEVDLNRPREKAVYIKPEDAWGLHVWKETPSPAIIEQSRARYDAFYAEMHRLFTELEQRFGRFVVYDLHTYNHRRAGPKGEPADIAGNPEVNVGTGTLDQTRWGAIVQRFMSDIASIDYLGRQLDVRENVKFVGGRFASWTHENFPESGCVLSIEFKKFFMDEWTGEPDQTQLEAIRQALQFTTSGTLETLKTI